MRFNIVGAAGLLLLTGCGKKSDVTVTPPAEAKQTAPEPAPKLTTAAPPAANPALADEPPIIAKARARLGSEAALDAVTSVHYSGALTTSDSANPTKGTQAKIDMIFQKPEQ